MFKEVGNVVVVLVRLQIRRTQPQLSLQPYRVQYKKITVILANRFNFVELENIPPPIVDLIMFWHASIQYSYPNKGT